MMIKFWKICVVSVVTLAIGVGALGSATAPAFAASEDYTLQKCRQGELELGAFLQTLIGFGGWNSYLEYWKDLFRNDCHSDDILMLDAQQDKVKKEIQDLFLQCRRDEIPPLEKAYYEIDAEITYVRGLVNVSWINEIADPVMDIVDKSIQDIYFTPTRPELYNELSERYGERIEDFDQFFDGLEVKYSERKYSYIKCNDGSGWDRVKKKFDEFVENVGGFKDAAEEVEEEFEEEVGRLNRAIDNPPSSVKDFINNSFGLKINGLDPEKGMAEIFAEAKKHDFWSGGGSVDSRTYFNAISQEGTRYSAEKQKATLEAKYESLYRKNTDETIKEFLHTVGSLQSILMASMDELGGVYDCVDVMVKKQCPGK